jgi:CubicO group peptidase (beta-lactamase class C family)
MKENQLTFGLPEEVGIPSAAITEFLERLQKKRLCLHGLILWRKGKVVAEGYAAPFHKDRKHRMYSISKTFVSAAIGLLVDQGLLSLSDRVVDFFPGDRPAEVHPFISMATVHDLLCMATPFDHNTYSFADTDWVKTFFYAKPTHAPGTVFSYNTAATVVLNALVEKLAGELFLDYMRPRLLDPIGFSKDAWCIQRPEGGSWGGSGVLCTLRDLTKFALVFLNGGKWEGRQLLSEDYVKKATSCQVATEHAVANETESYGYGYQIWRTANNGFAMHGMGGQIALCLPDQELLLTTIGDLQSYGHSHDVITAFWDTVYKSLSDEALPENKEGARKLADTISAMSLPLPLGSAGKTTTPLLPSIQGRKYIMENNPMGITQMCFDFAGDTGRFHYTNKSGDHVLTFGLGHYVSGKFPEPGYAGRKINVPGDLYACDAAGAWFNDDTLHLTVYITDDYLGALRAQFTFRNNGVSVYMRKAAENFLQQYQGFGYGTAVDSLGCSCLC